jgi:hypothetical protein
MLLCVQALRQCLKLSIIEVLMPVLFGWISLQESDWAIAA